MLPKVVASQTSVQLTPAPIEPSWILEGKPSATSAELFASEDGRASTLIWECTAGRFSWHYDYDETVYILDGSVVVESETLGPTRFSQGDVVLFRRGACATWHVEHHVRKLAFVRIPETSLTSKIIRRVRQALVPEPTTRLAGTLR